MDFRTYKQLLNYHHNIELAWIKFYEEMEEKKKEMFEFLRLPIPGNGNAKK